MEVLTEQEYTELDSNDDEAKERGVLLDIETLNDYRLQMLHQPNWRVDSAIDEDYYDSNQIDQATLADMDNRGIPPVVVNMIGPTIDMVLGVEEKTRADFILRPEVDQHRDMALAMTQKLKEAERMSKLDRACSLAYADQLQAGIGWVEVSREADPFEYRYRVARRDWREFWWDMFAEEPDLSDAEWLNRRRWYNVRRLKLAFPDKADTIDNLSGSWQSPALMYDPRSLTEAARFYKDPYTERDYTSLELEYVDIRRKRACIDEIWYKVPVRGLVMIAASGRAMSFDERNPMHLEAERRGLVEVQTRVYTKMRMSYWIGPERLLDRPTPYKHNDFPYVPFIGYREKRTRIPYGLIRRMRPLQDEINARRSKMMWGLSARRVFVDADAVLDHDVTKDEISRADAYVVLNSSRRPNSKIQVEDSLALNEQQFRVYLDSKQSLQDSAGVYHEQLYKHKTAESGVAINQLVEQSMTTLAVVNGNFRDSRMAVGERMVSMIVEDMAGQTQEVRIVDGDQKRTVTLNRRQQHETLGEVITNDVTMLQASVVLEDVPSSPTFRMQQFQEIARTVAALPEQLQGLVADMVIEASEMPNKEMFTERLRQAMGIQNKNPDDMSPEEIAAQEAQAQEQADMAALNKRAIAAKIAKDEAGAARTRADAIRVHSATAKIEAEIDLMDRQPENEGAAA